MRDEDYDHSMDAANYLFPSYKFTFKIRLATLYSPYRYGDPFCGKHECICYSCFAHTDLRGDTWYFRHYLN